MKRTLLGRIVGGSLTEGLVMRVNCPAALSLLKTGKFVSIVVNVAHDQTETYFSLVTDLSLAVANPDIVLFPPDPNETLLLDILNERDVYAQAFLRPMLMLNAQGRVGPVKTIPPHFTSIFEASHNEVSRVFGDYNDNSQRYFHIGFPLDMTTPICLDLERFTERSNGIFGKTGTGKTFLTRLVLAGLIKNDKAVVIIFDMHSEYGIQARQEGNQQSFVKGLKTLFPDRVALFSLDPDSTRRRGCSPDVVIKIPYSALHVEDVISLQDELNLHTTAMEAAYLLSGCYKQHWLRVLLEQGTQAKELAQAVGAHPESIAALYRKLKRLERYNFLYADETPAIQNFSVIDQMMEYLNRGVSVVVEFGNYTSTLAYLLVANIISRRIHQEYMQRTEKFLNTQSKEHEPKKLMICIEEAHKFLNTTAARQTIFGTIAREMRKYYVALLVVDQRPSGIDQEILSQIGTKIIAQLNDEKDIQAVLVGTNNAAYLRSIIGSLDSKQQALLLGHALPMPVVIQTRNYDESFYQHINPLCAVKDIETLIQEIF